MFALPLAPIVVTFAAILCGIRPWMSGLIGSVVALVIGIPVAAFLLPWPTMPLLIGNALVITLSGALVLAAGLYLNEVLKVQGVTARIVAWLERSGLSNERVAVILVIGMGPAVGSATGFGVSLFLTVPVLTLLVPGVRGLQIALLATNIVPWGTLALATLVAANLIGQPLAALSALSSATSLLVFPALTVLAVLLIPVSRRSEPVSVSIGFAVLAGFSMPVVLWASSRLGFPDIAGLVGGVSVTALALISSRRRPETTTSLLGLTKILTPYGILVAIIFGVRLTGPLWRWMSSISLLETGETSFQPFANPSPWLALTAVIVLLIKPTRVPLRVMQRAVAPSLVIFTFVLLAQIMQHNRMIEVLVSDAGRFSLGGQIVFLPVLAAVSGFVCGSNFAANILMMPGQYALGQAHGAGLLFAAMQNSGAGHAVMAGMSMLVLLTTIGRQADPGLRLQPRDFVPFAMGLMLLTTLAVVIMFGLLVATGTWMQIAGV